MIYKNFEAELFADGCVIEKYLGKSEKVTIPNVIEQEKVIGISKGAFKNNQYIKEVTFGKNIVFMESEVFLNAKNLEHVNFNDRLKFISSDAFTNCYNLRDLFIPQSVEDIEPNAFYDCHNLESIVVDPNNKTFDSRNNSNALIETKYDSLILGSKNTIIPEGIKEITACAFLNIKDLKTINLPDSLESILDSAFSGCTSLTKVIIPKDIDFIDSLAFDGCLDLSIYYRANNEDELLCDPISNVKESIYGYKGN